MSSENKAWTQNHIEEKSWVETEKRKMKERKHDWSEKGQLQPEMWEIMEKLYKNSLIQIKLKVSWVWLILRTTDANRLYIQMG